jgi:predicted O-linked N-acetylglucosamine transferase (SPINDLY family)
MPDMSQVTIEQAMQVAAAHSRAGRVAEAEAIYRHILAAQPNCPGALHELGVIVGQSGQLEEAMALIRRAMTASPENAGYHCDLGSFQQTGGQTDDAIASYQRAISLDPAYAEAFYNLAIAWKSKGNPDNAMACNQRAVGLKPDLVEAHNNLGILWKERGQYDLAIASFRTALKLRPDYAEAHNNLGAALRDTGQTDEAIACYQRALLLRPDNAQTHNNLGTAWRDKGQIDKAIACYQQAVTLQPDLLGAHSNLGNVWKAAGQLDRAIECYQRALALDPNFVEAHDNLLHALQYHPDTDRRSLFLEFQNWNGRHGEPLRRFIEDHGNDRDPERQLRIGYVSPDFRDHPVGRFMLPLLAGHDRNAARVFCYAEVFVADEMTAKLKSQAHAWRSTVGLSNEQVARAIREDKIDILVDLAMHTADNRLLVFARKPAPVQVAYLASLGGAALDTIDYRLTDRHLDPDAADDRYYMQESIRLPGTYWCYQQSLAAEAVHELPAIAAGRITLGCLNHFAKVSADTLRTWATLLDRLPTARLLLHIDHGSQRDRVNQLMAERGIAADRLELLPHVSPAEYFQIYHRIDIALDPLPFAGGTTTCDALWMGVPVVTLAGRTAAGRAGVSILSSAGLPELIARTPQDYVQIAADLAGDLPRLAAMRSTLRQRMQSSPLMDADRFARDIEAAYRSMWRTWCQTGTRNSPARRRAVG